MNQSDSTEVGPTSIQIVVFSLGEGEYAFPIRQVREIICYIEPRPVPLESTWIRGLISVRGEILPVWELAALLGVPASGARRILIVRSNGAIVSTVVDEVREIMNVTDDQLAEVPAKSAHAIDGIVKVGDRLIALLDSDVVFPDTVPLAA